MEDVKYVTILGAPNYVDSKYGSTLVSGSAVSSLPASNLQNSKLYKVWRTAVLTPTSTWVQADLKVTRMINGVSVINHNWSQTAQWRIRLSNDATFSTFDYDSGWMDTWPYRLEFGALDWGYFDWGDQIPLENTESLTLNAYHTTDVPYVVQYIRVDVSDIANPDGYVQAGRLVAGPAFRPSINMQYGWGIAYEDPSVVGKSRGGVMWADEEDRYRVITFQLVDLGEAEIMNNILDHMDRRKGVTGDMVIIPQPDHVDQLHNQAIYGRMRKLNPNINSNFASWDRALEFEELL